MDTMLKAVWQNVSIPDRDFSGFQHDKTLLSLSSFLVFQSLIGILVDFSAGVEEKEVEVVGFNP